MKTLNAVNVIYCNQMIATKHTMEWIVFRFVMWIQHHAPFCLYGWRRSFGGQKDTLTRMVWISKLGNPPRPWSKRKAEGILKFLDRFQHIPCRKNIPEWKTGGQLFRLILMFVRCTAQCHQSIGLGVWTQLWKQTARPYLRVIRGASCKSMP